MKLNPKLKSTACVAAGVANGVFNAAIYTVGGAVVGGIAGGIVAGVKGYRHAHDTLRAKFDAPRTINGEARICSPLY